MGGRTGVVFLFLLHLGVLCLPNGKWTQVMKSLKILLYRVGGVFLNPKPGTLRHKFTIESDRKSKRSIVHGKKSKETLNKDTKRMQVSIKRKSTQVIAKE